MSQEQSASWGFKRLIWTRSSQPSQPWDSTMASPMPRRKSLSGGRMRTTLSHRRLLLSPTERSQLDASNLSLCQIRCEARTRLEPSSVKWRKTKVARSAAEHPSDQRGRGKGREQSRRDEMGEDGEKRVWEEGEREQSKRAPLVSPKLPAAGVPLWV